MRHRYNCLQNSFNVFETGGKTEFLFKLKFYYRSVYFQYLLFKILSQFLNQLKLL